MNHLKPRLTKTLLALVVFLVCTASVVMFNYPIEAKIIEADCMGCEACVTVAPSLFEIENDVATFTEIAANGNIPAEFYDEFLDAYSACPSYAIKFEWELK